MSLFTLPGSCSKFLVSISLVSIEYFSLLLLDSSEIGPWPDTVTVTVALDFKIVSASSLFEIFYDSLNSFSLALRSLSLFDLSPLSALALLNELATEF